MTATPTAAHGGASTQLLDRYQHALMGVFGTPQLVLERGEGPYVWDVDGTRYLDLLAGIAVNSLGHGHPALVEAIQQQSATLIHTSNLFTTPAQIELAERLLTLSGAPEGSAVFLCNSGSEANEAAIKLARRTGRHGIVAAIGAFHGRTTGAVSLTAKEAYRAPFAPLLPGVEHVPYGDIEALRAAVDETTSAVFLEPIQGEAGVIEGSDAYLTAAREITRATGALLILDEVQTGIGRTGDWFAFQRTGIVPDAITVAKGLGGGVPIGGLIAFGAELSGSLTAGQHGTTFGGNPLACAAANAVLTTIETDGLLDHVTRTGQWFADALLGLGHRAISHVRGRGLLLGLVLTAPVAPALAGLARAAGFIVNAPGPDVIRLAPPLIITTEQAQEFVDALPALLDAALQETT